MRSTHGAQGASKDFVKALHWCEIAADGRDARRRCQTCPPICWTSTASRVPTSFPFWERPVV